MSSRLISSVLLLALANIATSSALPSHPDAHAARDVSILERAGLPPGIGGAAGAGAAGAGRTHPTVPEGGAGAEPAGGVEGNPDSEGQEEGGEEESGDAPDAPESGGSRAPESGSEPEGGESGETPEQPDSDNGGNNSSASSMTTSGAPVATGAAGAAGAAATKATATSSPNAQSIVFATTLADGEMIYMYAMSTVTQDSHAPTANAAATSTSGNPFFSATPTPVMNDARPRAVYIPAVAAAVAAGLYV